MLKLKLSILFLRELALADNTVNFLWFIKPLLDSIDGEQFDVELLGTSHDLGMLLSDNLRSVGGCRTAALVLLDFVPSLSAEGVVGLWGVDTCLLQDSAS
jgi:hypothetical protein